MSNHRPNAVRHAMEPGIIGMNAIHREIVLMRLYKETHTIDKVYILIPSLTSLQVRRHDVG